MLDTELKSLIEEVLEEGYLMSLSTLDDGGVWTADVIYLHGKDLTIYWVSSPEVRHSKALLGNPKVAGTITVSGRGEANLGIQFEGTAAKIEGARFDLALAHYAKREKPAPEETEDVLDGDSWYQLKPSKIELIHEKLFGFDKQILMF